MNKIKIVRNQIIPFDNDDVIICDNTISFSNNGNYLIEFIESDNVDIEININDNLCINLFEYSCLEDVTLKQTYNLGKKSSLILNKFYNNTNTLEQVEINLNGEGSNIKYNFSSVSSNNDKYTININHLNKNTSSNIFNRTVAKNNSSNIFDINSYVENGIKDCYLNQQTKIISLRESNNKINPNMFTRDNSTIAIHSSTIGNIDSESLFYLMSRGIDYQTATTLIIKGLLLSNINPDMETRGRILNILDKIGGE